MPPPVSSAVILTKAVGGNEVSHGASFFKHKWVLSFYFIFYFMTKESHHRKCISIAAYERSR